MPDVVKTHEPTPLGGAGCFIGATTHVKLCSPCINVVSQVQLPRETQRGAVRSHTRLRVRPASFLCVLQRRGGVNGGLAGGCAREALDCEGRQRIHRLLLEL